MMYSLEALDPQATLFNAVVNSVNGGTAGCSSPRPPTRRRPPGRRRPTPTTTRTTSPSADADRTGGTCTAPAWVAATAYVGGTTVSYNGHTYTSKWWTQGEQPDTHSGPNDVWVDKGSLRRHRPRRRRARPDDDVADPDRPPGPRLADADADLDRRVPGMGGQPRLHRR